MRRLLLLLPLVCAPALAEDERPTVVESIHARIVRVGELRGDVCEVVVDRGSEDGFIAGWSGTFASAYSRSEEGVVRDSETRGNAVILSTTPRQALVQVTLYRPEGAGLAQPGDLVEIQARVPRIEGRSLLWDLARLHIEFREVGGGNVFNDYRLLFRGESPPLVGAILEAMLRDVRDCAEFTEELSREPYASGRFAGRTCRQVMETCTTEDLSNYLRFVRSYPGKYLGYEFRFANSFATWIINEAPGGADEVAEEYFASGADEEVIERNRKSIVENGMLDSWQGRAQELAQDRRFDEAHRYATLAIAAARRLDDGVQLGWGHFALGFVLREQGRDEEGRAAYEESLRLFRSLRPDPEAARGETFALNNLGVTLRRLGELRRALETAREGLRLKQELGRPATEIWRSWSQIGDCLQALGEFPGAAEAYAKVVEAAREAKNPTLEADALLDLSKALKSLSRYAEAAKAQEQVVGIRRRLRDPTGEATAMEEAGSLLWSLGDYRAALEKYEAVRAMRERENDRSGLGYALTNIGSLRWNLGDYEASRAAHEEALRIRRELGDEDAVAASLLKIGEVFQQSGDVVRALEHFEEARAIRARIEDLAGETELIEKIASIRSDRSEWELARDAYDRAVGVYRRMGAQADLARTIRNRGAMRESTLDYEGARRDFEESLEIRTRIQAKGDVADSLLCLGRNRANVRRHDAALELGERALAMARELGDRLQQAECHRLLARVHGDRYENEAAIRHNEEALAIYRAPETNDLQKTADALIGIGYSRQLAGDFAGSGKAFREALEVARGANARGTMGEALDGIASVLAYGGDLRGALAAAEEQARIGEEVGNGWQRASAITSMADILSELGESARSREAFGRALTLYRDLRNEWGTARVLHNRSLLSWKTGDLDSSEADLGEGLPLAEKLEDKQLLAAFLTRRADLAADRKRFEEAIADYDRALGLAKEIQHKRFVAQILIRGGQARLDQARALLGRKETAAALGALDATERALQESRRLAEEMGLKGGVSASLRILGAVDLARSRIPTALALLRESLRIEEEIGSRHALALVLDELAAAEEASGDLDAAVAHRRRAVALLEELRGALGGGSRAEDAFLRNKLRTYEALVDLLGRLQMRESDAAARGRLADEALALLQRARFELLKKGLEGVSETGAAKSDDTLQKYRQAERDLSRLQEERAQSASEGNVGKARAIDEVLATTEAELVELYVDLQAADSDLASRLKLDPQRIAAAMAAAPANATLLLYFPGETKLYIWVIGREGFREWRQHNVPRAELYRLVGLYRDRVEEAVRSVREMGRGFGPAAETAESNPAWYRENIRALREVLMQLHEHLIAPVAKHVEGADPLLILPYGQLNYLPFEALLPKGDAEKARFLGEEKRIAYFLSERHLQETLDRLAQPLPEREEVWVAFADPRGRLSSSLEEAMEIERIFPKHEVYTQATGNATEEQVIRLREDCSILHIATHGFLNAERPSKTFLEMASPPGDGMLAYAEIGSKLRASAPGFRSRSVRLVVLSACETARAQENPESDVLGMPDAFTRAGAPAVIASLWSVYTYSTTDTMIEFYRRLGTGKQDKATALQGAKRELLTAKGGKFAHPFFWAPFLLFGDWR
jgi:CHAT domain-containing protein